MLSEADKEILKEYFGEDNLRLAFERYKRTLEPDTKDFSGIDIFDANLDRNIKSLSKRLLNGIGSRFDQFTVTPPLKFYIPKKTKGSQRTYTLLFIEEAIVYQSIVDKIAADNFIKLNEVNNSIFSYRLNDEVKEGINIFDKEDPKFYFFEKWQDWYPEFRKAEKKQLNNNKNQYKLETDISGFYDTVQHNILLNFLEKEFNVPKEITEFLGSLLNSFSGTPDSKLYGVGLPQGPSPSHFLAQLMLYNFDLEIIDKGYASYLRYVDDIVIFSKNENDLYRAKASIERQLKDISLYMNSKKTDISFIGSKENRKKELQKLEEKLFSYLSIDEAIEKEESRINEILNFDIVDGENVFPDYDNIHHLNHENTGALNKTLKNEKALFETLIKEDDTKKLVSKKEQIINDFLKISYLMSDAEGIDSLEHYIWTDDYLELWILLYENSLNDSRILKILDEYYTKTEKLKTSLLYLYHKYDYLEWVQHKLAIILCAKEFNFNSNELSEFYRNNIDKISVYAKLSFYLFFILKLDVDDSLFSTIKRRLKKDDKGLFYFKDWIIWQLRYLNTSNKKLMEVINLIGYDE